MPHHPQGIPSGQVETHDGIVDGAGLVECAPRSGPHEQGPSWCSCRKLVSRSGELSMEPRAAWSSDHDECGWIKPIDEFNHRGTRDEPRAEARSSLDEDVQARTGLDTVGVIAMDRRHLDGNRQTLPDAYRDVDSEW